MKPPLLSSEHAFTLVEMALALGILSFAIVPLIGLLSVGIQHQRKNIDRSVEAQILSWANGDIRLHPGDTDYTSSFDSNGLVAPAAEAVFTATLVPASVELPGSSVTLKQWKVTMTSPAREGAFLGQSIIWEAQ